MTAFSVGHASARSWQDAARKCVQALGPMPPAANLGFFYFTDHFAGNATDSLAYLKTVTGIKHWVGSVGVGVLAGGIEYFDQPAMVVMVAALPEDSFRVFSGKSRPPALGELTASGAVAAHFGIVHADPQTDDVAGLIEDMSRKLDSGFLVGGLSSSRAGHWQVADDVLAGGLSGVVLASDVALSTRITQGCAPLEARHRVTSCERNILITLDDRPALDVFIEDIGPHCAGDLDEAGRIFSVGLPVEGSDTGDYLVRNLAGIDRGKKLLAIGDYPEAGMQLMFCRRDGPGAREDLLRMLDDIRPATPPRGGLYFACVGRGASMFGERSAEMQIIREQLGDFPLAGFFANGEISHDRLYGYTGVLTLFL
jgi:small ligand-binding sensory domain FIST